MSSERGNFGTRLGVILATAGGAVGLGNVWRFPYVTGQNGGAAFILIYIGCVLVMGIPVMLCEMMIGRHAQANTARAYSIMGNGTAWKLVGLLGVLTSALILGYYSVVSGWTLQYIFSSIAGNIHGTPDYFKEYFTAFSTHPIKPIMWGALLIGMTHFVIVHGVQDGIEKASKIMMPVLFLLLLLLVVCSLMLPGSMKGVEFLFHPDFSKVTASTFFDALGQTFFTLSTGMACLVTYASYFGKDINLTRSAFQIAAIDTLVAILSGLVIFPAAFSVGVQPDLGPSLIFITLPNVFQQAFAPVPVVGYLIGIIFYVLLVLAALTSIISMHETPTAFVSEEFRMGRKNGARIVTVLAMITGALCSLSLGPVPELQLFGKSLFDFFDFLSANILLTLGGFLTSIYVGWVMPHKAVHDQMTNWGTLSSRYFHLFVFAAKYVCPLGMLFIFLHQFGWV